MSDKKIDVLLEEYEACYKNRNHYDSVRWTIGSIFVVASLTLFGISFLEEVGRSFLKVFLIAVFSFLVMLIWYAYSQHVDMYVLQSIKRLHEIERTLQDMGFDIKLQKSIYDRTRQQPQKRGAWITYLLFVVILGAWCFRMMFLLEEIGLRIAMILICVIILLIIYEVHMRRLSARNLGNEIAEIWGDQ